MIPVSFIFAPNEQVFCWGLKALSADIADLFCGSGFGLGILSLIHPMAWSESYGLKLDAGHRCLSSGWVVLAIWKKYPSR